MQKSLVSLAPITIAALLSAGFFYTLGAKGVLLAALTLMAFAAAAFLVAALSDIRTGRIDNMISVSLVIACLAVTLLTDRTLLGFAGGLLAGFLFVVAAVLIQLTGGGWIKLAGALCVWAVPSDWQIAVFLLPASFVINLLAFRYLRPDLKAIPLGPAVGTVGVILMLTQIRRILASLA
ncbi:MAG: prepilin peptidase [Pseudomonadota bacterium]